MAQTLARRRVFFPMVWFCLVLGWNRNGCCRRHDEEDGRDETRKDSRELANFFSSFPAVWNCAGQAATAVPQRFGSVRSVHCHEKAAQILVAITAVDAADLRA